MIRTFIVGMAALALSAASASARTYVTQYYGYAAPVFEYDAGAYYGYPAPSYAMTPAPIYAAPPRRLYGYALGYRGRIGGWDRYGYAWH